MLIRAGLFCSLLFATPSAAAKPGEGFDVELYAVSLKPDLATAEVSGHETITLRATSDGLTQIVFSPNALTISEARVDGKAVQLSSGKDGVTFALPRALAKGRKASLSFRFAGKPAKGVTAVAGGIYTGYFACDWMICLQDSPGDKAHLWLDLMLPKGLESVGVGHVEPVKAMADGMALHRWRSTRPYSPYLYAFAAGPFARQSDKVDRNDLVYLDGTGGKADLAKLFADTPDMVAFFSDKAGLPLPERRYIQVLTPNSEAQEAASFSMIGKQILDEEPANPSAAWVISHELAHQWWGNLVTCASFDDFWLNEGITTFIVAAWKQHKFGEAAYQAELDVARRRVDRVRALGFDKPLTWDGEYPSLSARRAVQYSKGALFMVRLRETLGEKAFWAGLRAFTQKHAGGTVVSRDFQLAMEKASGRDLSGIFAEWVYGEAVQSV
jgi:aminopeptidase N